MKKVLFTLILIFLTSNLFCQSFEWEVVNAGLAFGFSKDKNGFYNQEGGAITLGSAFRYNFKKKPLSIGFDFTFSGWNRISDDDRPYYHQNAHVFLLTADYNYTKIHPKFIPFAGIGVGNSLMREWGDRIDGITYKLGPGISPRVGFEFFKRLRFTT
ncbi:MAG: hypothetical protein LBU57_00590, partial [Dysgonamonadaceae bacterium]|nr:hypothetical protein [Dysgonamonadaceae bacterium]